ncbi:hypothetical protein [Bradyrhizobium sp. LB11.1]|uniref:hypothetical protein n=1 Tax=Bradyrhizobium sp. LB11.1 TaxID=3156326 RepID=UPI00339078D9
MAILNRVPASSRAIAFRLGHLQSSNIPFVCVVARGLTNPLAICALTFGMFERCETDASLLARMVHVLRGPYLIQLRSFLLPSFVAAAWMHAEHRTAIIRAIEKHRDSPLAYQLLSTICNEEKHLDELKELISSMSHPSAPESRSFVVQSCATQIDQATRPDAAQALDDLDGLSVELGAGAAMAGEQLGG